ncbi:PREDICTED: sororin isoform X2 [Chinchilla lanigera]|uniref:sororin isoform X2 n=1 Tax=Chinchilla lanigera TaxID=34839 RepID=UPI00038EAE93|nr:PREDICTED: sororin isoform X2 [Chinchilla lanigera]
MSGRLTRSVGASRHSEPTAPSPKPLRRSQRKSGSHLPSVLPEICQKAPPAAPVRKPIVLKKIVAHAVKVPAVHSPRRSPRIAFFLGKENNPPLQEPTKEDLLKTRSVPVTPATTPVQCPSNAESDSKEEELDVRYVEMSQKVRRSYSRLDTLGSASTSTPGLRSCFGFEEPEDLSGVSPVLCSKLTEVPKVPVKPLSLDTNLPGISPLVMKEKRKKKKVPEILAPLKEPVALTQWPRLDNEQQWVLQEPLGRWAEMQIPGNSPASCEPARVLGLQPCTTTASFIDTLESIRQDIDEHHHSGTERRQKQDRRGEQGAQDHFTFVGETWGEAAICTSVCGTSHTPSRDENVLRLSAGARIQLPCSEQKPDLQPETTFTFLFTLLSTPEPKDPEPDVHICAETEKPGPLAGHLLPPPSRSSSPALAAHLSRDLEIQESRFLSQQDWGPKRTSEAMERLQNVCVRLREALSATQADNLALGEKLRNLPSSVYEKLKQAIQAM